MYWNYKISDKICISFTDVGLIFYCLQSVAFQFKPQSICKNPGL